MTIDEPMNDFRLPAMSAPAIPQYAADLRKLI